MDIKENLKIATKTGFITLRSIMVVLGFGVLLNWIFAIVAAITASHLSALAIGLLVLVFVLGLPMVYFLIGKTYGIRRGLSYVIKEQKIAFFQYIIGKMLETSQATNLNYEGLKNQLVNTASWLNTLPQPFRWVAQYLIGKVPFNETLLEVVKSQDINMGNINTISESVAKKLDEKTTIDILEPDVKPFWVVVGLNIILMVLMVKFML